MKNNLPILLALIAGITMDYLLSGSVYFMTATAAILLVFCIFTDKYRALLLATVCGLVVSYGYNLDYRKNGRIFPALEDQKITVSGKMSNVRHYPFRFAADIIADSVTVNQKTVALAGKYQFFLNYTPDFNEGDQLTLTGKFALYETPLNIGEFDRRQYAFQNHLVGIIEYPKINYSQQSDSWLDRLLFVTIQGYICDTYNNLLSYRNANFQNALFLGVKTSMDKEDIAAFANSGTLHLLAVSGMHVAFLMLLLAFINRFTRLPKKVYTPLAIIILWGYTLLTGASPSVVRAFVMAAFFLLSYPLKRLVSGLDLLAGAGIFSLLLNPNQLFSLSFQLSYLAVLSILLIYQRIEKLTEPITKVSGKKLSKYFWEPFNISIAVSLGTLPLLLYAGNGYNLLSILVNVPLVPMTTLSYLVGIILLITAQIPVLGEFNAYLLDKLDQLIFVIVEKAAAMDLFILDFKAGVNLTILLFAILVYLLAKEIKLKISAQVIVCGCLVFYLATKAPETDLYIFSLKKGGAAYLRCGTEKVLCLKDLNAYETKSRVVSYLQSQNISSIDYLAAQNLDTETMSEITKAIKVKNLISPNVDAEITGFAQSNQIKMLSPEKSNDIIKLTNGRIYCDQAGFLVKNAKHSISLK